MRFAHEPHGEARSVGRCGCIEGYLEPTGPLPTPVHRASSPLATPPASASVKSLPGRSVGRQRSVALIQVATQASLPRRWAARTTQRVLIGQQIPTAAIADAIRVSAWSCATRMSRWIRLPGGRGASIRGKRKIGPRPRWSLARRSYRGDRPSRARPARTAAGTPSATTEMAPSVEGVRAVSTDEFRFARSSDTTRP